ncbi:RNA transcription, translation and transport factor protein [Aphelenchoides besseyi]|nr:RNA transcription, translation and transport factor protein [Aphelenchoides besseyi]KAI6198596.1 RNA transcription, translation and transport factor protein [Aphelenchoides besseyi]
MEEELVEKLEEILKKPQIREAAREFAATVGLETFDHPDPMVILAATVEYVNNVLDAQTDDLSEGVKIDIKKMPLGVKTTGSDSTDELIKLLRILNVQQLRETQTAANHVLVEIQKKIAQPKTDLFLGKRGR